MAGSEPVELRGRWREGATKPLPWDRASLPVESAYCQELGRTWALGMGLSANKENRGFDGRVT